MKKFALILAALLLAASACACNAEGSKEETTSGGGIIVNPGTEAKTDSKTEETTEAKTELPADQLTFTEKNDTVYIISKDGAANLRKDTLVSDSTLGVSLKNGTQLERTAVSTNGEWSKVKYDGKDYYIKNSLITDMADPNEGFVAVSKTVTVAKDVTSINVRIIPSFDNDAVGQVTAGDVLEVVAEKDGWYKIKFKNAFFDGEYYITSNPKYYETEDTTSEETSAEEQTTEKETETEK